MEKNTYVDDYHDIIWAMRQSEDSDCDSEKLIDDISFTSKDSKFKTKEKKNAVLSEEYITKILASLVPDEVIYNTNNYDPRTYDAAVLFGDVSGFTSLSEYYTRTTKGGASTLTLVLNNYLGALVAEILAHGGDIIKFSGDAFLTVFKTTPSLSLRDVVHLAIDTALSIQSTCGTHTTDTGVVLRVKLAISCGKITFNLIGNEKLAHYVVVGQPIFDIKAAEKKSKAGDILVNYSVWGYMGANEYVTQDLNDEIHMKVITYGNSWRATEEAVRVSYFIKRNANVSKSKTSGITAITVEEEREFYSDEDFSIRPSVNDAVILQIKQDLRKFIFPPVLKGIDIGEPLEYSTEMRQIVTVFFNIVAYKVELLQYIKTINDIFNLVSEIVDSKYGQINKVSLFDKDIVLIVLFGLRGYKDESESKIALKCAHECREAVTKLDYVKICSAGITTGMAYCGVIGHTLRREYTVIGHSINKAARFMMAYPGKVVCDRETFLHSKMEARHFLIQEEKKLKGISSAGPVYEFCEQLTLPDLSKELAFTPMLGRKDELQFYLHLLNTFTIVRRNNIQTGRVFLNYHSVLVIKGSLRMGKSRLIYEFDYYTPPDIPIYKITLTSRDSKVPFKAIQLIFATFFKLNEGSSSKEFEEKIISYMKKFEIPQLLCCLNSIFKVNFTKSAFFIGLSKDDKAHMTESVFKYLAVKCFADTSVVIIDNSEFMDDESWLLLKTVLDLNIVFLVITIEAHRDLSQFADGVLKHKRVRTLELDGIDKEFHAALACQILNVNAIPPELEKLVQSKSSGNPGWIESFLVSLIQTDKIIIKDVHESTVKDLGLITPPLSMLKRAELRTASEESVIDNWDMYKYCFKESKTTVVEQSNSECDIPSTSVRICMIAPGYDLEEVVPELSLNVMVIKTFDSLTSYEQLLLKTSSVLGNTFLRDMLLYIMGADSNERNTTLAVKKLFEIRVLQCARGDFTESYPGIIVIKRKEFSEADVSIKCVCLGNVIHDKSLPKYAFCGYMKFRLSVFRETTYNLLTETQKKEYHTKAIKYLEKETRRCRDCGNGFFFNILGAKTITDLKDYKSGKHVRKPQTTYPTLKQRESSKSVVHFKASIVSTLTSSGTKSTSDSYSHVSITDLKNGEYEKFMNALLEYSYLCIEMSNIPQAMRTLKDAEVFLHVMDNPSFGDEEDERRWRSPMIYGHLKTLLGYAYLELGQSEEAISCLSEALACYGYKFPQNKLLIKQKLLSLKAHQTLGLLFSSSWLFGSVHDNDVLLYNRLSECLSLLCELYMDLGMWEHAELAAAWSLNKALAAFTDFYKICIAFANMIEVSYHNGKIQITKALEVHALQFCHRKKANVIEIRELKAVCKLYVAIFCARIMRSEIESALHIGYIMLRLGANVHAVSLCLKISPIMFFCLLANRKFTDAIAILSELFYYAEEDVDNTGKMWYYALSLVFNLETGYTFKTYDQCKRFYEIEGVTLMAVRDPDAEKCFYIVLWLWCLRNDNWSSASLWYTKVHALVSIEKDDSIVNMIYSLYLLEGLLLFLVGKMDYQNFDEIYTAHKEIKQLTKRIEDITKHCKIIAARLLHLKAYSSYIRNDENQATILLTKAKKVATKYNNLLEILWIEHSEQAWSHNMPSVMVNFWKEHCLPGNTLNYHEAENNDEMPAGLFTLPVPHYDSGIFF